MNDFRLRVLKPRYEHLFASCLLRNSFLNRIAGIAEHIISLRSTYYNAIEAQTSVPWWFVGILHYRECNFQDAHLLNGDALTGRTMREPAGRPEAPPAHGMAYTFIESAVDALRWKTFNAAKDRSIAAWLWRLEMWNGFDYAERGINSEYLWNGTNHFGSGIHRGKLLPNGTFDPNGTSDQAGAAAIVWYLHYKGIITPDQAQAVGASTGNGVASMNTANFGQSAAGTAVATAPRAQQATIQLIDVFKYYQKLPHQDSAVTWLQQQIPADLLAEFARRWREGGTATLSTPQAAVLSVPSPSPVAFAAPAQKPRNLEERIIAYCEEKGYIIDRGAGEKNIIYVEGMYPNGELNDDAFNCWNDARFVIEFKNGVPVIAGRWEATTEPGRYYTMNPMNINGAARIAFGQYRAWRVGTHLAGRPSGHEALVQVGEITVHRDLNKDGQRSGDKTFNGSGFGVNQHWGGDSPTNDIGRWSAGCLVGRMKQGHREFMTLCKSDPRYQSNKSYSFLTTVIPGDDLLKRFPVG